MTEKTCSEGFCGIGSWRGVAEVYNGEGQFLGNGVDQRHVRTQEEDGRIKIDLSFVGPLKFSGHYFIRNKEDRRLYQGPVNCGFAESISEDLVTANGYWPVTGLSQKFFLMMSPDGNRQLSLALMSRGEQLIYAICGENGRVIGEQAQVDVPMQNGTSFDLKGDANAGRGQSLLHREGEWSGTLKVKEAATGNYSEHSFQQISGQKDSAMTELWAGNPFLNGDCQINLKTNGFLSWSEAGDMVGSYSSYGGRASSGQIHYLPGELRVWRREVCSGDGSCKAVVNTWYEGEKKVADQWGILEFRPKP